MWIRGTTNIKYGGRGPVAVSAIGTSSISANVGQVAGTWRHQIACAGTQLR